MANRRAIAPRTTDEFRELMDRLTSVEAGLSNVTGEVRSVGTRLATMDTRLGVIIQDGASTIAILDGFGNVPGATSSAPVAAASVAAAPIVAALIVAAPVAAAPLSPTVVALAAFEAPQMQETNRAYGFIRRYLKTQNFRSNNPDLVEANNRKPSWRTDVAFNESPNKELVLEIMAYLQPRFLESGLRYPDLRRYIYTNFNGRRTQEKKSFEKRAEANARSRRNGRQADHLTRRREAYSNNKAAIDQEMDRDCSNLIQKAAMSEGESDDEGSDASFGRRILTARPSWRSDEFNHFLELVDDYVLAGLGTRHCQMLRRKFGRVDEVAVPEGMVPPPPEWAVRN
ncbi:hypothetical protein INT47_002868 [Mucor saturninus]|uniref:Uncharacterized protein n=1 Tax=Mucor saturninus TaxID=64648 RepID=A0A8H7QG42_9FUNG|nr:hypothetical protein INT47_002868 [Mucor saturninus]